jgi:hypothetical protein
LSPSSRKGMDMGMPPDGQKKCVGTREMRGNGTGKGEKNRFRTKYKEDGPMP